MTEQPQSEPGRIGSVEGMGSVPAVPADQGGTGAPAALSVPAGEVLAGRPATSSSLWRWRGPVSLVGGVLFALLGLLLVLAGQAHGGDTALENARPADLVAILDSLEADIDRLESEKRQLNSELDTLTSGTSKEALARAEERLAALQVLAGTTPVRGPGVVIEVADPNGGVDATDILDAIQELRDAGAESIEINERRVVMNTWFAEPEPAGAGGVVVSGDVRTPPYTIKAIGNSDTLATAMEIPGGVADTMRTAGADFRLTASDSVEINSVVKAQTPEYAEPAEAGAQ